MGTSTTLVKAMATALLAAACTAAPADSGEESAAQVASPIQGGVVDNGDPAVGIVLTSASFCTGTLIGPSVVLTAAHCIEGSLDAFYTGTGTPGTAWPRGMTRWPIDRAVIHPSYHPGPSPLDQEIGFDLALVHLTTPMCTVTPWTIDPNVAASGATCLSIGFGNHTEGWQTTTGQKRSGLETADGIFDDQLVKVHTGTGASAGIIAPGDSGGPLVCTWWGIVSGVASFNPTFDTSHGFFARVDSQASWITSTRDAMTSLSDRLTCISRVHCTVCN